MNSPSKHASKRKRSKDALHDLEHELRRTPRVDQFKKDPDTVVKALAKIGEQIKHNPEKAAASAT